MEIAVNIEGLSYEQLVIHYHNLLKKFQENNFNYEKISQELNQLKKLVFGSKHERFEPVTHPGQLQLDLNLETRQTPEVTTQTITYTRQEVKTPKKENCSRMKLPDHLPREIRRIEPTEDVTGMIKIGEEITEVLEMRPPLWVVIRYVRSKFANLKPQEGVPAVVIGQLPARIIDKGLVGPGFLSQVIVDKY